MIILLQQCRNLAIVVTALALPMSAIAQPQGGQPPTPDFAEMAQALGVSEKLVKSCLPAPQKGRRPGRANPSLIASCLKKENASITTAQVSEVFERYGPKPPRKN